MTDRRDPEEEDLRELLADLESTLMELRGELDDEAETPRIPRGLPGGGRRAPRPPRLREVVRFTEEYTIPTLIAILEANIRLLRLGGAALRALDPERSAVSSDDDGAVRRAIDAGRGLSTDRLAAGLDDLNDALAGADAPDPEARELLSEAEELSTEIQNRLRQASESAGARRDRSDGDATEDAVRIDVNEADGEASGRGDEYEQEDESESDVDVDAELDSIRDEVRGSQDGAESVDSSDDAESVDGPEAEDDSEKADDPEEGDDADGTALE